MSVSDDTLYQEQMPEKRLLAKDTILNKPYVSEEREAFLFLDELEARAFRNKHKEVKLLNVSSYGIKDVKSICHAAGAEQLVFVQAEGKQSIDNLPLSDLNRQYYNSELNALLGLQLKTKNPELVPQFGSCVYIVAVNIDKTREQYLMYASAKTKSGKHVLLAFSDLKEFTSWRDKYGKVYKPLEVDFLGLQRLGGNHGFLINPDSSKFYLSPEFIKLIQEKMREKAEENNV